MRIRLHISYTQKPYRGGHYTGSHFEDLYFPSVEAARMYLDEKYGNCKRTPIYTDGAMPDIKPIRVGYVFCYRDEQSDQSGVHRFLSQDWVSFFRVDYLDEKTIKSLGGKK